MQGRLSDRIAALERHGAARDVVPRSNAERDAVVAAVLGDPAAKERVLATMAGLDEYRRAAVSAALRADR